MRRAAGRCGGSERTSESAWVKDSLVGRSNFRRHMRSCRLILARTGPVRLPYRANFHSAAEKLATWRKGWRRGGFFLFHGARLGLHQTTQYKYSKHNQNYSNIQHSVEQNSNMIGIIGAKELAKRWVGWVSSRMLATSKVLPASPKVG